MLCKNIWTVHYFLENSFLSKKTLMSFEIKIRSKKFEDTKGVFRIRKSMKTYNTNCHNGQKKKDKQRSTKHTHKTKDRVTSVCPR